jgi:hypothetical protein
LRNIVYAQIQYAAETGEGSYATTLVELAKAGLIDAVLASGAKDYYSFYFSTGADKTTFSVRARPLEYGTTGNRSFYMNESGVIRYTTEDRPATAEDPSR